MSTCHSNNTRHAYESTRTLSKPSRPLRKIVNSLLLTISFLENSFPIGVGLYCATKIQNFFEPVIYLPVQRGILWRKGSLYEFS